MPSKLDDHEKYQVKHYAIYVPLVGHKFQTSICFAMQPAVLEWQGILR